MITVYAVQRAVDKALLTFHTHEHEAAMVAKRRAELRKEDHVVVPVPLYGVGELAV